MLRSKPLGSGSFILLLASGVSCAQPAMAAQDYRQAQYQETNRAAFAGGVVRFEMGPRAKPPATRLQIGWRSLSSDRGSDAPPNVTHVPMFELGFAGKDRGNLFVAGQPTRALERKLGLNGDTGTTAVVVFSVALLAVGLLVITNLDSLDSDDQK